MTGVKENYIHCCTMKGRMRVAWFRRGI